METIEISSEILTEILPKEQINVNMDFLSSSETKEEIFTLDFDDTEVIILLFKSTAFGNVLKPYEIDVYGKEMWQWVQSAADDFPCKNVAISEEASPLSVIKPHLGNKRFTLVLYSDTPLIKKSTVQEIMMFARSHDVNVLKLARGFVFNTQYAKNVENISEIQSDFFDRADFFVAKDFQALVKINEQIKSRILAFHLSNGVYLEDVHSIFIDCDVAIESGAKIMANNTIKGISYIGKNVVLQSGNIIENSIISDGCNVISSVIRESKVSKNQSVGPFICLDKISK
ncbi:MAG: hypothetical protein RR400_00715 [Clostridia bacterium]